MKLLTLLSLILLAGVLTWLVFVVEISGWQAAAVGVVLLVFGALWGQSQ